MAYIPQKERDKLKPSQFAGPNRTFPIRNAQDVRDAAHLIGKAPNPDAVKKRIIAIAKRHGWKIPESWQNEKKAANPKVKKVMGEWKRGQLHSGSKKGPVVTDQRQAVAIALSEAQKGLLDFTTRLKAYAENNKTLNYGAKVGQNIGGNLSRGQGGRFTSAGNAGSLQDRQRQERRALQDRQSQERNQARQDAQGQKIQNIGDITEKILGPDMAEMLTVGDKPGDLSGAKPEYGDKLVAMGLAQKLSDGSYILNGSGRSFLTQAAKGDARRAQQIAERAQAAANKRNAPKKSGGKKGGGKGKAPKGPKLSGPGLKEKYGPDVEEALSLMSVDPEAVPNPDIAKSMLSSGLIEQTAPGKYQLTKKAKTELAKDQKKEYSSFAVFKDATGNWRWLAQSSSAYRDRDGEIVSTKALEDDCARADATGQYGPLRVWHLPGVDIGACDFNAMHGRLLIESGTFKDEAFGACLARAQKEMDLGVSIGFRHPITEPDHEQTYHRIERFERSVLPLDAASNLFTSFKILGGNSMDERKKGFLARLFGGDAAAEKALETVLSQAEATQKAADAHGIAFKAKGDMPPAQGQPPVPAEPETKADGMPDPGMEGGDMGDMGEEPEGDEGYENSPTDIAIDAMIGQIYDGLGGIIEQQIKTALQPILDGLQTLVGSVESGTKEAGVNAQTLKAVKDEVAALKSRLDGLESEQPPVMGYRASQSKKTVAPKEVADAALKEMAPQEGNPADPYALAAKGMLERMNGLFG